MSLAKQEYWNSIYKDCVITGEKTNSPLVKWILKFLPILPKGSCIEIGVFPGNFIEIFGRLGYEISGIDLTPRVIELNDYFKSKGYHVGEFRQEDFLSLNKSPLFDIVCSFGFIEHFEDYESMILMHGELLKEKGVLIITTPNFRGKIQYYLHKWLDNENLLRHNVNSMCPENWAALLEKNGFDVIESGYLGSFEFGTEIQKRNYLQKIVRRIIMRLIPFFQQILPAGNPDYAPYCGIIARKRC